jgi:hypothetical protein
MYSQTIIIINKEVPKLQPQLSSMPKGPKMPLISFLVHVDLICSLRGYLKFFLMGLRVMKTV